MSDYRRWISYIYSYEHGEKKNNAGYARIELKDGRVKMTIYMTPGRRDGSAKVCFYKNQPGHPAGVLLGSLDLSVASPVFRIETSASNMMESGLFFVEMNGLLLVKEDGQYYASSWEEESLGEDVARDIIRLLNGKEKGRKGAERKTENRETAKEKEEGKGEAKESKKEAEGKKEGQKEKEQRAENQVQAKNKEDISKSIPLKTAEAEEISDMAEGTEKEAENTGGTAEGEKAAKTENSTAANGGPDTEADGGCKEDKGTGENGGCEKSKEEEGTESGCEEGSGTESGCKEGAETDKGTKKAKKTETTRTTGASYKNCCMGASLAERIFCCLPPMYPFEEAKYEKGVRMNPQDIGMLPRSLWKLAGNSFLLHSYYTYHHLLFVKQRQKDGAAYFLMLPGIYNRKEQNLAQMFGFCNFCAVKRKNLEQGDFGYWYLEVKF